MKVTFTKTTQYESEGRNKGPIFEQGKTYEMSLDQGNRWVRRQVAVAAKDSATVAALPDSADLDKHNGGLAKKTIADRQARALRVA